LFSRRNVIAAGLAVPLLASARTADATDSVAACRANLARLFPRSLDAARKLGARCGDGQPLTALLDRLCETAADRERLACGPADDLGAMLGARIRADFTLGRTRRVDGWVLSETEARLFAILAG
jgi:hypothetical protein